MQEQMEQTATKKDVSDLREQMATKDDIRKLRAQTTENTNMGKQVILTFETIDRSDLCG